MKIELKSLHTLFNGTSNDGGLFSGETYDKINASLVFIITSIEDPSQPTLKTQAVEIKDIKNNKLNYPLAGTFIDIGEVTSEFKISVTLVTNMKPSDLEKMIKIAIDKAKGGLGGLQSYVLGKILDYLDIGETRQVQIGESESGWIQPDDQHDMRFPLVAGQYFQEKSKMGDMVYTHPVKKGEDTGELWIKLHA